MPKMERYTGVRGKARVAKIAAALERCGATVLTSADPSVAPFEFRVRTPQGETLDLVCYAFTANKYRQEERPKDEHRFQVKYGGDFKRLHELFIDPARAKLTLMFGVHDELDVFVAIDPTMHTPTWFSSSFEAKEENLERAAEVGWHGWERDRAEGRRRVKPRESLCTETVIALRSDQFLRYIMFERFTSGLDPGERLLLSDRIEEQLARGEEPALLVGAGTHPLEEQLGLSAREILDVLSGRFRLLAAVRGGVAEHHLETYLRTVPDVSDIRRIDEDGQPDFTVRYRHRSRAVRIECKNVLRRETPQGPRVDFQKTRASTADRCSRYYAASQFEVLAACVHPVTTRWEFRFLATAGLPEHKKCPGKLTERVIVAEPFTSELPDLLDRITSGA
jgi:hypothetical protein